MNLRKTLSYSLITLVLAAVFTTAMLLSQQWVVRYPGPIFDPKPLPTVGEVNGFQFHTKGAYQRSTDALVFRASAPLVTIYFTRKKPITEPQTLSFSVENIHPKAELLTSEGVTVDMSQQGLQRTIMLSVESDLQTELSLQFSLPQANEYTFGVLGDSGGNSELTWGLNELAGKGVDFILHLGDLYYSTGEQEQAAQRYAQSAVPVYTTIGNHEYRGPDGPAHLPFMDEIGPVNSQFQLLNTCFLNLDTGTYQIPASGGQRGKALKRFTQLVQTTGCEPVVFTHKPLAYGLLTDIPLKGHTLDNHEAKWLQSQLQVIQPKVVLAGHVHYDFEYNLENIPYYVTGTALAASRFVNPGQNLKYIVGHISNDKPLSLQWINNTIPQSWLCSEKVLSGAALGKQTLYRERCKANKR